MVIDSVILFFVVLAEMRSDSHHHRVHFLFTVFCVFCVFCIHTYFVYFVSDGEFIIICIVNDRQFTEFCNLLGLEYSLKDERFKHNQDRVNNRDALVPIFNEVFVDKTRDEWSKLFEGKHIPHPPINNMEHVFLDPNLMQSG